MGLFDSIVNFGKSVITGLPGMALDLGGQLLGNQFVTQPNADRAYEQSQQATSSAYALSREGYKSRYQDTMADMKKAGLNPILAASGGFNIGTAPTKQPASAYQANQPTYQPTTSQKSYGETKRISQDTKKAFEDTRKSYNEANHILEQITKTKSEGRESAQRVKNLIQQHAKLIQEVISASTKASSDYKKYNTITKKIYYEVDSLIENLYEGKHILHNQKQKIKDYFNKAHKTIKSFFTNSTGDN